MKIQQVALQIYTLRSYLKTPADITATLRRVRAIGYQAVELLPLASVTDSEIRKILADEGLVCCSTHEQSNTIRKSPESVAARLEILGCQYAVCSYPSDVDMASFASVHSFTEDLEAAGKVLAAQGKTLCYHNHGFEFRHLDGRPILEMIYDNAPHLQGELDTYWVQSGGANPAAWCRRLKGRLPLLHIKDYGVGVDNMPVFSEIGSGNLQWPEILLSAEESGCQWFIVEQDTCPGDPFDSVKQSFNFIQSTLLA